MIAHILKSLLLLALVATTGCASITRGTTDALVVTSDPSGASVRLSNGMSGVTPATFVLPRKNNVIVTIEKKGYEKVTVNVVSQVDVAGGAGMAGNVLVGGLIGAAVDASTGAMKSLVPNPVAVTLIKSTPVSTRSVSQSSEQRGEQQKVENSPSTQEYIIGRWCDRRLASTEEYSNLIEIVGGEAGSVVQRSTFADGASTQSVLEEVGDGVFLVAGSSSGERYRIVPNTGDLQILDNDGVIRTASRIKSSDSNSSCY